MRVYEYRLLYLIYNIEDGKVGMNQDLFIQALKKKPYCVQYRSKRSSYSFDCHQAKKIKRLCIRHQVPFIINDSLRLARRVGADGLHIGQQDAKLTHVKKLLTWQVAHTSMQRKELCSGHKPIVGVSCYNRLILAIKGKKQGANYLAFGTLFPSPTKPDKAPVCMKIIRQARFLALPIVVIGGISPNNLSLAKRSYADAYAMISGINQLD